MESDVFFVDFKTQTQKDSKVDKLQKLYNKLQFNKNIEKDDKVAIKLHFGELGNDTFIQPLFIRQIIDNVKKTKGKPFVTDTNTLYHYKRHNSVDHLETANKHGFNSSTLNAPVIIADGMEGYNYKEIKIFQKHFQKAKIARDIVDSECMIVLSHVKGHVLSGFGGSLKNLAMGCASKKGKEDQHKLVQPIISKLACVGCKACVDGCPEGVISVKAYASIDYERCIGCNDCISSCPTNAIKLNLGNLDEFMEGMMEYVYGAVKDKPENKIIYINFLMDIIPECDCTPYSGKSIVPDIGIVASYDPVALDQASYDLINKASGIENSDLKENKESGKDKFKGLYSHINGETQISEAEKLGLGTKNYKLIKI
ncbi:MAG: DUF362 domain-containing protein [Methanobacteriaceae archaeon]|nr:DUF362 domain-containing protein [Methanobacteriaceae archaeon]